MSLVVVSGLFYPLVAGPVAVEPAPASSHSLVPPIASMGRDGGVAGSRPAVPGEWPPSGGATSPAAGANASYHAPEAAARERQAAPPHAVEHPSPPSPSDAFSGPSYALSPYPVADSAVLGGASRHLDASGPAPSPRPTQVYSATAFPGISFTGWYPPDVQVAAGPNHVMEMVNGQGQIWTKAGSSVQTFGLTTYFLSGADQVGDPKVGYDATTARWFSTVMDLSSGGFAIAVSASSDPTGAHWVWQFFGGPCTDQPLLGISDDKVVVSVNEYSNPGCGSWLGAAYWVLNKADLLAGSSVDYVSYGPFPALWSVHPVHSLSSTPTLYMAANRGDRVTVFSITGVPPGAVTIGPRDIAIAPTTSPPDAPQAGTAYLLPTGDYRIQDALWQQGRLWIAWANACTPPGDVQLRSCLRLVEVDTTSMSLRNDFDYGASGAYYFYPAMRTDPAGDLLVVFGYSSAGSYPGLMVAGRAVNDPAGFLQSASVLVSGMGPETAGCSSGRCRYGDYFGAAVDPADPAWIWVAGEYGQSSGGWATYVSQLRLQVAETLSYLIVGGGTGYSPPTLTYQSGGAWYSEALSTSPVTFDVDAGTTWYFDLTLPGSTATERWQSLYQSGIADVTAEAIVLSYYHQFLVAFGDAVVGGGQPTVSVTFVDFGATVSKAGTFLAWVDANTAYAFGNPVDGAPGERWFAPSASGTITSGSPVVVTYFHEYRLDASFSIMGGGSPPAPVLQGTAAGTASSLTLTAAGQAVWVDAGTLYAVTNPLVGSTSSERWYSSGLTSGSVSGAGVLALPYYHQYVVAFGCTVSGGGSGYSAPSIAYTSFGATASAVANTTFWGDAGSTFTLALTLPGSSGSERWQSTGSATGAIDGPAIVAPTYYHQYWITFAFSVLGGGTGYAAPDVTHVAFGRNATGQAVVGVWADVGSAYAFVDVLAGSNRDERWTAEDSGGVVSAPTTVTVTYTHQYYVTMKANAAEAGTLSAASGWYDSGSSLAVTANAAQGWRFETWQGQGTGSYTGAQPTASVHVDGPVTQTAIFYVGLTIDTIGDGSVSYTYGGVSGTVPAGTTQTVFVLPGTNVTLSAIPGAFHGFLGWTGAAGGQTVTAGVSVSAPARVGAAFSPDPAVPALLIGIPLIAALLVLVVITLRRRRPSE